MKHKPNRTRQPVTDRVAAKFFANVDRSGDCWLWTGKTDKDGYGIFYKDGGDFRAHRAAYEIGHGVAPGDMCVCHRCDNPRCVNPEHMFLGTSETNTADRNAKGRQARGVRQHLAKLDDRAVVAIRASAARQVDLAAHYGVSQAAISFIKLRQTWKHVP